ncbi:MAG: ABC transporter ATP-binding protein, partial [Bacteriovoracaceae bacterium]|nr:ABC transporter ATP-binding protein [Bacteriovoracaceae bacterium]
MERDITTLSGGELQRLYLACAVSPGPKVLLLDEALSAMDPHIQEDVIQKIVQFQKQKEITIIHVSHQINNAIHISDKVLALKDGENFYSGDCKEFNQAKIDELFDYKFNYTEHPQSGRPVILPGSGQ